MKTQKQKSLELPKTSYTPINLPKNLVQFLQSIQFTISYKAGHRVTYHEILTEALQDYINKHHLKLQ